MLKLKNHYLVLTSIFFIASSMHGISNQPAQPMYVPQDQMSRGPGDVMLSTQELEELQAMEQLVEQERSKMSPAQRAEFDNTVAELTKELEKMQPEELDAFISQVIFGQEPNAPLNEEAPQPQYAPQPAYVHAESNQEMAPLVDHAAIKREELLASINNIIAASKTFLDKINTAPNFTPTLKKWVEQKKLKNWKTSFSWETIKKQIEELIEKLEAVKKQDKSSQRYLYIDQVVQNEDLCVCINKLSGLLKDNQHDVEIDPLGYDAITKESKQALISIVNGYLDIFNVNNILVALQNIIAPKKAEMDDETEFATDNLPEIKTRTAQAPAKKTTEAVKLPKHTPEIAKEASASDDSVIGRLVNKLDSALEGAAENINESALKNIKAHLTDPQEPRPNYDTANNNLPNAIKKIKTAIGNIKALKVNIQGLPAEQQKAQQEAIKATCKKHKNTFDDIIKQAQWIKTHENVVSIDKKYAFLAGPRPEKTKEVVYPSSLYELQKNLEEFESAYKTL